MYIYGMMEHGGWMFFWWLGGLLLFGAVIYAAVRLGTAHVHRDEPGPCGSHDDRYYRDDGLRGDDRRWGHPNDRRR